MAHYQEVVEGFGQCKDGAHEFMEGIQQFKKLESVPHAIEAANTAAMHHLIDFPKDVAQAIAAVTSGDWNTLGDKTGELTGFVLAEC